MLREERAKRSIGVGAKEQSTHIGLSFPVSKWLLSVRLAPRLVRLISWPRVVSALLRVRRRMFALCPWASVDTTYIHLDRFTEVQNSWPVGEILFITSTLQPVPTHPPRADHAQRLSAKHFSYLQINTRAHLPVPLCLFNSNYFEFSCRFVDTFGICFDWLGFAEDFFLCSLPDPGYTG